MLETCNENSMWDVDYIDRELNYAPISEQTINRIICMRTNRIEYLNSIHFVIRNDKVLERLDHYMITVMNSINKN